MAALLPTPRFLYSVVYRKCCNEKIRLENRCVVAVKLTNRSDLCISLFWSVVKKKVIVVIVERTDVRTYWNSTRVIRPRFGAGMFVATATSRRGDGDRYAKHTDTHAATYTYNLTSKLVCVLYCVMFTPTTRMWPGVQWNRKACQANGISVRAGQSLNASQITACQTVM